jgi:GT2 family glycosyltransferase
VNWNRKELTRDCISSLLESAYPTHTIVLVDNGSQDRSADYIEGLFPGVNVIRLATNLGYTGGNNVGIQWALDRNAEYVHLLNNDAKMSPDALRRMIEVMESDRSIGIAGPMVLFHAEPNRIWSIGGKVRWYSLAGGGSAHLYYRQLVTAAPNMPFAVDYVPGCSLLVRTSVIKRIGLLDQDLFAFWEDVDWAWRAKKAGFRIVAVPNAVVWHHVSSTAGGVGSPFSIYMMTKNRLWVHRKNQLMATWLPQFLFFMVFLLPAEMSLTLMKLVRGQSSGAGRSWRSFVQAYTLGVLDFVRHRPGNRQLV